MQRIFSIAAALIIGMAASAHALSLYDSAQTKVGDVLWQNEVAIKTGNHLTWFNIGASGLTVDAHFFYQSSDCTGTPFLQYSPDWYIIGYGVFDGTNLWGPALNAATVITTGSFGNGPENCAAYQTTTPAAPAKNFGPVNFVPPFSVR